MGSRHGETGCWEKAIYAYVKVARNERSSGGGDGMTVSQVLKLSMNEGRWQGGL
jgi:hypothetical protein